MSLGRNTAYGFLARLSPAIVTLVTVPIYIRLIGVERYGVLATAWLLLGYFGAFDLGLGRALAYRVAFIGNGDPRGQSRSLWSASVTVLLFGMVGGVLLYLGGHWYFSGPFNTSLQLQREVLASLPILAVALPFSLLANLLNGALNGQERFGETSLVTTLSTMGTQVLPLIAAGVFSHTLFVVIAASSLVTMCRMAYLALRCAVSIGRGFRPEITRPEVRELLQFGGWVSLAGLVAPALQIGDRMMVGWLLDARAVSVYTVPNQIAQRASILSIAVGSALFPRLAAISGKAESRQEASELTKQATRVSAAIMTPVILGGIVIMEPFLTVWLSGRLDPVAGLVGETALLAQWFSSLAVPNNSLLQASGRPRLSAMVSIIELVPFFAILIVLTHYFGLMGTAVASALQSGADYALSTRFAHGSWRDCFDYVVPAGLLAATIAVWQVFYLTWEGGVIVAVLAALCCLWSWRALPAGMRLSLVTRVAARFRPSRPR